MNPAKPRRRPDRAGGRKEPDEAAFRQARRRILSVLVLALLLLLVFQMGRLDVLLISPVDAAEWGLDPYDASRAERIEPAELERMPRRRALVETGADTEIGINIGQALTSLGFSCSIPAAGDPRPDYGAFDLVVILETDSDGLAESGELRRYAEEGGRLICLGDGNSDASSLLLTESDLWGIRQAGGMLEADSIHFNTELLVGLKGDIRISGEYMTPANYFQSLEVDLTDDCVVHLESGTGNPLIWTRPLLNGQVCVLNTGHYASKDVRGFVAGAVTVLFDVLVYPVIGSLVVFIDDFPADYRSEPELIKTHYNRSFQRFILELWWPEMLAQMQRYDLKYTGAFVETYDDDVTGPFAPNSDIRAVSARLAGDLLARGGEICLHGRNHQPLFFDQSRMIRYGYRAWSDAAAMEAGLRQTDRTFTGLFPGHSFLTYVPPSNLLQPEAIAHLTAAVPTLRVLSGVYYGEHDGPGLENPDDFDQEYGLDSRYGIALPRTSSGMYLTDEHRFMIASALTTNGIICHFIHPDDILDPDRSGGLLWEDLARACNDMFAEWQQRYGWLNGDTAADAALRLEKLAYADVRYSRNADRISIVCDRFCDQLDLIVTSARPLKAGSGCTVRAIGEGRWLVTMQAPRITLEVAQP